MNILMIGGTGTISYDATKFFISKGHEVYLLNRGNRNDLKYDNLHYILGDANELASLENALKGKTFDIIFDFIIFNTNQMKMRLKVYEGKCKQFFFISSATVYQIIDGVTTEETPLANFAWKYSRDKIECEKLLTSNEHSFKYTIIRPYVTYDDRRIPFPVITKKSYYTLIDRIKRGKPIVICGKGDNTLTLTHTKDFAVALEGLMMNERAYNQAFHITGGLETTWNEIIRYVFDAVGQKTDIVYIPVETLAEFFPSEKDELLYDKSQSHHFDNSKICSVVPAFKANISVEEGIKATAKNLLTNPSLKKVDELWNAEIDVIVEKYENLQGVVQHKASPWAKFQYYIYEETSWTFAKKVLSKIYRLKGNV